MMATHNMQIKATSTPTVAAVAMSPSVSQRNMAIMCRNPHAVVKQHLQDMPSAVRSSMVQSQPVTLVTSINICSLLYQVMSTESMPAKQNRAV